MNNIEHWEAANKAFQDGTLDSCSTKELQAHLMALSNQQIYNETIQHRDVIRGLTINHLLLQRHLDSLNRQNTKTQRLVIALTIAALLGTAAQLLVAL